MGWSVEQPHKQLNTIKTVQAIQSTLTLRTPRYYRLALLLRTAAEVSENKKLLKTTPATTDFLYYGQHILVPMVSVMKRVDCKLKEKQSVLLVKPY